MKIFYIANHETGDMIEDVNSIEEGEALIKEYEESDKAEGIYEPNFYCVMVKDVYYIQHRYGLNIKQLSERFGIPYRTVQNWVGGQRECPKYLIGMMDEILENS